MAKPHHSLTKPEPLDYTDVKPNHPLLTSLHRIAWLETTLWITNQSTWNSGRGRRNNTRVIDQASGVHSPSSSLHMLWPLPAMSSPFNNAALFHPSSHSEQMWAVLAVVISHQMQNIDVAQWFDSHGWTQGKHSAKLASERNRSGIVDLNALLALEELYPLFLLHLRNCQNRKQEMPGVPVPTFNSFVEREGLFKGWSVLKTKARDALFGQIMRVLSYLYTLSNFQEIQHWWCFPH